MKKLTHLIWFLAIMAACTPTRRLGTIKFAPKKSDNYISEDLRSYIKNKPSSSILVRSFDASYVLSEQESHLTHRIFGAIEKEFLQQGFEVRDRGLFNSVLSKTDQIDYSGIAEITKTDLILELTGLDTEVEYNTNKYLNKKGKVVKVSRNISMLGIQFKFRIVDIATNQIKGLYEYNIAPCMNGCKYYIDRLGRVYRGTQTVNELEPYEFVEVDDIEIIMSVGTSGLIRELKR